MNRPDGDVLAPRTAARPREQASAYTQMGGTLREFHRIPMDVFGCWTLPRPPWTSPFRRTRQAVVAAVQLWSIESPDWQDTLDLYRMYCVLSRDLEAFV
jgi:hypothetical protein